MIVKNLPRNLPGAKCKCNGATVSPANGRIMKIRMNIGNKKARRDLPIDYRKEYDEDDEDVASGITCSSDAIISGAN